MASAFWLGEVLEGGFGVAQTATGDLTQSLDELETVSGFDVTLELLTSLRILNPDEIRAATT